MRYFPPDELKTVLRSNASFTMADSANDVTDVALFQLGGALEGTGKDLVAAAGGTTGISAVQIAFELPRSWNEWITHYSVYSVLSTYYDIEFQNAASDTTGAVWICWWFTASESRDIPGVGINLADGLFDTDNANFTGTKQISQIIMNARGIRKVRIFRADAMGGRRRIRVRLNHFMGPAGEVAGGYEEGIPHGFGSVATLDITSDETTSHGVSPQVHFALINQDFSHGNVNMDVFIKKYQLIHFMDRITSAVPQVPT